MKKLFLLILLFPLSAFSNNLSGTTWALSHVGCRDSSLSPSSHRSKPISIGYVSNGKIEFIDDRNFIATATRERKKRTQRGTYSINGDRVDTQGPNGEEGFDMYIQGDTLIMVSYSYKRCCPHTIEGYADNWRSWRKDVEASGEDWEEFKKRSGFNEWTPESWEDNDRLREKCAREYPFVQVIRQVS